MSDDTRIPPDLVRQIATYWAGWVALRRDTLRIPGIQVALLHEDALVVEQAHGLADIETAAPLRTESLFRIASHSKMFTATAVLQLLAAEKLRLDDPVGQWVDWVPASLAQVTLRELLSHGGGVIRDGIDGDFWQHGRPFPTAADLLDLLGSAPAIYPRNEHFKYSNIGFGLLGAVIEAASGQPYNAYVREHIVDRLGLERTGPEYDPTRADEYATGYTKDTGFLPRRPIEHVDTGALSPATGFYSTAGDLCRFATAHFFGDDTLLDDDAKRLMQRREWKVGGYDREYYGLGMGVRELGDRVLVGHSGGYPGHITDTLLDPKAKLTVSVLTNALGSPVTYFSEAPYKLLDLALKDPGKDVRTDVDLDRFCGRYGSLSVLLDIVRFGDRLYALSPDSSYPTDGAYRFEVVDERTLRGPLTNGFLSPGEPITFDFEDDVAVRVRAGSAKSMLPYDTYAERLTAVERVGPSFSWEP